MFVSMEKEKSNTAASSEAIGRDERKTCKICSQLSVNPRSLKCNHFFCEECLLTYLQNLEQETEFKVTFPCPVCQQTNPYSEGKVSLKWIRQLPEPIGVNEMTEKKLDLCSPCDSTGESHPAARYCIDCDELLCKTCVDYHMKFKSSKAHKLVHCNKEDSFKGAQLLSSYLVCPSHNDKAVEVKCEVHNDLCCLTCATITHRNCQSISEIRQLAAGCKTNGQTDTLRTRIEGVNCCIEEIISANDTCRKEFDTSLEEIPKTLEQIKANLMKLYDNIEACVLDKVKDIRLDESVTTENRKEKWSNKLSANVDLLKMIDAILEVGTDSQVYVTIHKVKQILEENEKALADQGSHIVGQSLQLNVTEKLECILKTAYFQSLVCVESMQSQHQLPKVSEYSNNSAQDELMLASDTLQELEIEEFPPVISDDSMPITLEASPVPEHAPSKNEAPYPIPRRRGPQPTQEQIRLVQLCHVQTDTNSVEDAEQLKKIKQIIDLTGCTQDKAEIALYDNKNDMDRAVIMLLQGEADQLQLQPQNYDVGKPNYAAPRMPNPGVVNQPAPNMYQSQQPQGMRPNAAPFYQGNQQQGIRQRFPSNVQNTQNQPMYPATGGNQVVFINSPPQFGTQQVMMSQMMGMPRQQYNATSLPQQNNVYQQLQQQQQQQPPQPPTTFSHTQGYGNLPMFYNNQATQQRPPSTGQQTMAARQKHVLKITDPNTGKDILLDRQTPEHSGGSSDSGSRSTPVSGSSVEPSTGILSQSPHNEIAAEFAAKVAATLSPGSGGSMQQHRPPSEPSPAQRMQPQHFQSSLETSHVMPQQMMDGGMVMPLDQQQQAVHIAQPGMAPPSVPIAIPGNMHHTHQHRTQPGTPPHSVEHMNMNAPAVMDSEAMGLVIESIEQPPLNSEIVVEPQGLSQGDMPRMHPIQQQTHYPQNVQPHIHQIPQQIPQVPPPQVSLNQPPPQPPPQPTLVSQPPVQISASPQQVSISQAPPMVLNQPPPKVIANRPPQQPPQMVNQVPPQVVANQAPLKVAINQPPPQMMDQPKPQIMVPSSQTARPMVNQPPPSVPVKQPQPPIPEIGQQVQMQTENVQDKTQLRRQSEPVVSRQNEPIVSRQNEPVVSRRNEPVINQQTEPSVQHMQSEPAKPVQVKDKSPPPPISIEHARGETVSVSVEKVSQSRTSNEPSDSVKQNLDDNREKTPEVNIVPPTPVEKEIKIEVQTPIPSSETSEPTKEIAATEVPKKSKKKSKDYDKKAEQLAASSDFDAYIDNTPEPVATSTDILEEAEKENVDPANRLSPDCAVPPPEEEESTPSDEMVQKVEIKIEDSEELRQAEDGEELELKEDMENDEAGLMALRYKYSEDQWSPINPEGKKHYDREFLLQFQLAPEAVVKPPGLPEIPDIILDKPHGVSRQFNREAADNAASRQDSSAFDFTPKYMWQGAGGGGGGGPRGSRSLPRQPSNQKNKDRGGDRDRGPPQRQINISISKDVEPLHKAKDAWKPSHKDAKDMKEEDKTGDELDDKTEELYKKTRSILNKLTPQKFQTLVSQMQALQADTESKLKGVIDLVFEKAISEPSFSVAYANMCRCLSLFKVPSESKPGESVNFRAVLLTRCQREFEKDKSSEILFTEKRQEIEKAEESNKAELKALLEYEESKAKRRSLGNIRFIGELFKLKMLTENIMHDCVFKLLRTKDPENLECLCRLLTTIGKELETDKARPRMDQYFQQMLKIVNEKKTSSRVKFMLQDVMDLRKNKWVPRRDDANPKTIDQIHKEVAKEAQDRAYQTQQALAQSKTSQKGSGGRRGPQGGPMGPPSSDGWNMVGQSRTPFKSIDRSIDPTKMKISKQQVDESSIQLGPGGGASRFAGWGRGSTGGGARASQEKERPAAPGNRFSALSKPEEENRRGYSSVSPARGEGRGRGGFGQPPRMVARLSQEQEREKAIAAAKSIGISQSAETAPRERSRGRELEKERPSPAPSPAPSPVSAVQELPKDEIDKKTKAILDEYLHIQDMKEAITCVKELPPANHGHFCANALNHVLERSEVARRQTGHLLHDLVKNSIVTVDSYIKGLFEILEFAEDMEIDIPKIWTYLGELVGQMIQDGSVPLSFLSQAAKPLVESNKAGIFVAEVLHDASHREGHKKVAELWQASGLKWTDFIPKNQIDEFLVEKKLEFTKGGDSVPTTPTTGLPMFTVEEELHRLIVLEKRDNETVFDWIESNVDEPTTKRSNFIRALMTCVCNGAFIGEGSNIRVEPKEVSKRHDLLQKYLDHQAESELQALYALQALVTKLEHPAGVLRQMFDTLYDEDIISEDAFIQWEKSDEEPEGKGVAMKQVVQFFTWLREAEDDNDS